MILIYAPDNTSFNMNGNEVLTPSICDATAELGGTWTLDMTHPIDDDGRWKRLVKEAVVSAPTFMGKKQLYRIDEIDKQDTEITVKAYPVFFDSADEVFLMDKRPTKKTGQETLDILTEGTKYSGESNITSGNTAYFVRRNLMDCLNGDSPSFTDTWGGEPLYDNYRVIINERAGGDYGAEVRYGMNMEAVSFKEDMSEVVTRIIPVAYNGRTLSAEYVDSPLINKYAKIYAREIKFEDVKYHEDLSGSEDTENLIVCHSQEELDAALMEKCNAQFEAGIDLYKITIDVDMVALENTEEYKDFVDLVKISLGDDVSCINNRLGITTKARAVKIKWDCITDSVKEVTLGDCVPDVFDQWSSTAKKVEGILNDDNSVRAEYVKGILNGINAQLKIQNTAAQKVETRAILFEDLDEESPMFGAMAIGTQGFQISKKRTADGRDWEWRTAFTAQGGYADAIITGLLADRTGKTYWNLDTGEFVLSPETEIIWGQIGEANQYVTNITKDTVTTEYVNTLKIKAGSVDAENITGETIEGKTITGSTVSGGTIEGGTITGTAVSGGTIKATKISGTEIEGGTITGTEINGATIMMGDKNTPGAVYFEIGSDGKIKRRGTDTLDGKIVIPFYQWSDKEEDKGIVFQYIGKDGKTVESEVTVLTPNILKILGVNCTSVDCSSLCASGTVSAKGSITGAVVKSEGKVYAQSDRECIYSDDNQVKSFSVGTGWEYLHVDTYWSTDQQTYAYGITWWQSDSRLKDNVKDSVSSGLDLISRIKHRQFDWKDKRKDQKHVAIGYVAQELQKLDEGLVFAVKQPNGSEYEELLQIDETRLLPYITKGIQELYELVQKQEKRIKILEKRQGVADE